MLISDSGPIIIFARAKKLTLLKRVVQNLIIPEAVYEEIVIKGKGRPGEKEVKSGTWIKIEKIKDSTRLASLPTKFGQGEKEAIILAQELKVTLLMDDPKPRKEAIKRSIKLTSSLDILQEAKDRNLIPELKSSVDELIKAGFRISQRLYKDVLKRAGASNTGYAWVVDMWHGGVGFGDKSNSSYVWPVRAGSTTTPPPTKAELVEALKDPREAMLKKIDSDVENTAMAFAVVKDYWRSKRWADIFLAPLRIIEGTLTILAKALDLLSLLLAIIGKNPIKMSLRTTFME